jgi:hypothetical protein
MSNLQVPRAGSSFPPQHLIVSCCDMGGMNGSFYTASAFLPPLRFFVTFRRDLRNTLDYLEFILALAVLIFFSLCFF